MKAIADTGFIVAFGNRTDFHHAWALDVDKRVSEQLLTCEAVLAEAAFHLGSGPYVLALVQDEMLRVAFDFSVHLGPLPFGPTVRQQSNRKFSQLATSSMDRDPETVACVT